MLIKMYVHDIYSRKWSSICDAPVPDPRPVSNRQLAGSFPWSRCVDGGWFTDLIGSMAYYGFMAY